MSLGLTKPGASAALRHPKTGAIIAPLYVRKDGTAVWPALGASPDDPDDPKYAGGGEEDPDDDDSEDEDEDDDEEEPPSRKSKKSTKSKKDDEDDDEEDRPTRPERQAARYRTKLREAEARNRELNDRLKALEDKDKKPDEIQSRDLEEAKSRVAALSKDNQDLRLQVAFFTSNTVQWHDPADALRLVDLSDVDVDEDGTVDSRALKRALRDLARSKPHLVKSEDDPKARGRKSKDDEDEEDDEDEPSSSRSASTMNGGRRGKRQAGASRDQLAKKFPILNRL